jgi:hypothetical protein
VRGTLRFAVAMTLLVVAASAPRARAEGFDVEHFEPSERGSDWFANESLDLRGNLRPAAGLILDWAHRPLVTVAPDGSTSSALIENATGAQLFVPTGSLGRLHQRRHVSHPALVSNDTPDGRLENRRVEFHIEPTSPAKGE